MSTVRDPGRVSVVSLARLAGAVLTGAVLTGAVLTGCAPTGGTASPTPGASGTATPSATSTPTATPTPTPSPTAEASATCEDLPAPSWTGPLLVGDELTAYIDKSRAEGSLIARFADYGGIVCVFTAGDEVGLLAATSPIPDADRAALEAQFADEGYTRTDGDGVTTWVRGADTYWPNAFAFADGRWWTSSSLDFLATLLAAR